jgi:hypothetical protein
MRWGFCSAGRHPAIGLRDAVQCVRPISADGRKNPEYSPRESAAHGKRTSGRADRIPIRSGMRQGPRPCPWDANLLFRCRPKPATAPRRLHRSWMAVGDRRLPVKGPGEGPD